MALDLSLQDDGDSDDVMLPATPVDGNAEDALVAAVQSWHAMRAQFEVLDPTKLSRKSRDAYEHLVARIGLWSDARAFGEPIEADAE